MVRQQRMSPHKSPPTIRADVFRMATLVCCVQRLSAASRSPAVGLTALQHVTVCTTYSSMIPSARLATLHALPLRARGDPPRISKDGIVRARALLLARRRYHRALLLLGESRSARARSCRYYVASFCVSAVCAATAMPSPRPVAEALLWADAGQGGGLHGWCRPEAAMADAATVGPPHARVVSVHPSRSAKFGALVDRRTLADG